jgi:sec-independent protein translocase protein TatA
MFGRIGMAELIIILLIVLLIFGAAKLPLIGRALGRAIREFRQGTKDIDGDIEEKKDASG